MRLRGKDKEGAVGSVGEHFDCCWRVSVVFLEIDL